MKEGNILTPQGFITDGVAAGLRYDKNDIGVIYTETPASSAAVYTKNVVQAAPIAVTKDSISKEGKLHGIIVNSGCANACTGEQGLKDAYEMRKLAAEKFGVAEHLFAVASTGVIGELLKWTKVADGIKCLNQLMTLQQLSDFETAIMTTDLVAETLWL